MSIEGASSSAAAPAAAAAAKPPAEEEDKDIFDDDDDDDELDLFGRLNSAMMMLDAVLCALGSCMHTYMCVHKQEGLVGGLQPPVVSEA